MKLIPVTNLTLTIARMTFKSAVSSVSNAVLRHGALKVEKLAVTLT